MSYKNRASLEQLEPRTFLSATPPVSAAQIAADKAEVQSAHMQLLTDQQAAKTQLTADKAALVAARKTALAGSAVLAQLQSDQAAAKVTIAADQTAISTVTQADLPAITTDYENIRKDKGNPLKEAADEKQLAMDQAKLQSDVTADETTLHNDRVTIDTTLDADHAAIKTFLSTNAAYTAAVATRKTDRTADNLTLQTDQAILDAAQAKLCHDEHLPVPKTPVPTAAAIASASLSDDGLGQIVAPAYIGPATSSNGLIWADLLEVQSSIKQFTSDFTAAKAQLKSDRATVLAARTAALTGSSVLTQLQSDQAAAKATLSADNAAISAVAQADLPAIITDFENIAADKGNPTKEAADKKQLALDQGKLQGDVSADVTKRHTDRLAIDVTLDADHAAIKTFLSTNAAYTAAMATLKSDRAADRLTLHTDEAIVDGAIAKLKKDLKKA